MAKNNLDYSDYDFITEMPDTSLITKIIFALFD